MHGTLRNLRHRLQTGDGCAFLVGLGGGLSAFALFAHFARLFDPTPTTWRMVLGLSLLALAVGVPAPHRLAARLAGRIWRRTHGAECPAEPPLSFLPGRKDRDLLGTLLAVCALGCGVAFMILAGSFGLSRSIYAFLLEAFLWEERPLLGAECLLVAVLSGLALVPVGLTWGCLHHLSCPVRGWRVRPLAGVCTGLAVAAWVAAWGFDYAGLGNPEVLALCASVPFLLLSVFGTRLSSRTVRARGGGHRELGRPVPRWPDHWSPFIRAAVVLAFACAVLSMGIWWRVFSILRGSGGGPAALAAWSLGIAAGIASGCALAPRRSHSIGALGMACALAGVGTAVATGCLGLLGIWAGRLAGHSAGIALLSLLIVGLPAAGLGHAIAYGFHAALAREGSQSEAGSTLLSRALVAGAVSLAGVLTPLVVAVGTYAALVAGSLTLVGVGGALIIHEPHSLRGTRRRRLAAVFGSIVFMALALPHPGGRWLASRAWTRVRLEENAWLTRSIWAVSGEIRRLAEPTCEEGAPLGWEWVPASAVGAVPVDRAAARGTLRVGVLGHPPQELVRQWASGDVEFIAFDPSAPVHAGRTRASDHTDPPTLREPAARFLRRTPRRYDLLIVGLEDLPPDDWGGPAGIVPLTRIRDRLRTDGLALLAVPARSASRSALVDVLASVRRAGRDGFAWFVTSQGSETTLWIGLGRTPRWRARWQTAFHWQNRDLTDPD